MKRIILILIAAVGFSFAADAQKQSGAYLQTGVSLDHHTWGQEVQFGGYIGKHQLGLLVASSGDAPVFESERPYYAGVAYQFTQPVGKTIDFIGSAKAKVNTRGANDIVLQPGVGLGFNITPKIGFQTGVSTQFNQFGHHRGKEYGQFDAALNFKF